MILDVLVHVGSCAVYVAFDTVVLVVNIVVVGGDNKVRRDFVHRCVLGCGAPKSECNSLVIRSTSIGGSLIFQKYSEKLS